MRNKILIVDANPQDKEKLEQILQGIVEEGGELIFVDKKEEGLAILHKEHPQLLFLDDPLYGEKKIWEHQGTSILLMSEVNALSASQVLEKCRTVLNHEPAAPIPPM